MARTSLEMGLPNFIDRDFTSLGDVRGLADLLPHLPGINLLDLLGQHDGRWAGLPTGREVPGNTA